jgi:putative DNA primase/helicase
MENTGRKSGVNKTSLVSDHLKLLGKDVVLLPIPLGCKGPRIKGWQHFTSEKMKEPEYLAELNNGNNIGVLLGRGLITIDIDNDDAVEPFLTLNPKLRETLRSRRARGCNLWARIKGTYPQFSKLKTTAGKDWGEWRGDGNQTVIYGEAIDRKKGETEPIAYRIINRAKPVELAFDEIQWPAELVLPWASTPLSSIGAKSLNDLRRLYGEPFYFDKDGYPCSLNQSFWAGLFASENIVLWEPLERAFYTYNADTGIYEEISVDLVKRRLSDRLLEASRQMNCFFLEKQRTDARLNNIEAHLRGIVERRNAFVQRERRIHLANGIFLFENGGELLPFSPAFLSRNRSPIVFDERATCPRFLNELVYPAMRKDEVVLMQKYFGLCLLGLNLIQRLLIFDGLSERGKTQLANAIQAVVGRLNCTQLRTEWLADRFETYRFIKKTLLVGVDVAPNFLSTKGAGIVKGLVGGDWFDAEQKGGTGSFQFQGNFCVIVTSNTRLRVRLCGDVGAWRRRLLIIRYEGPKPKKKIPDFGEKLAREEGSGILNFAIAGLSMLLKDIDKTGDIVQTERQRTIVDSLLAESDSMRLFLQEAVETADGADVSVNEIVEAYATFCPEKGWNPLPITEIHRSLEGLMLELFRVTKSHSVNREGKSVRGFFGVALK